MKKVIFLTVLFLPIISFATAISIKCQSIDVARVHKFDARGVVNIDDLNNVEGVISIHIEKAQSAQSAQVFEEVRLKGFIRHFGPGEIVKDSLDQLVLTTNEKYLKSLNILLGHPEKLVSKVYSIDNFVYRSNCKIEN